MFQEIEQELVSLNRDDRYLVYFAGDFNAHVSNLNDFISMDNYAAEQAELDTETRDVLDSEKQLLLLGIPGKRLTEDTHRPIYNNYGHQLVNLCKANGLYIMNGRIGIDSVCPQTTTTSHPTR